MSTRSSRFFLARIAILVAILTLLAPAQAQPIGSFTFTPNASTISTSEGAPYADCDFWVNSPSACNNFSNFGYGPTKLLRLYICLTGEVSSFNACSQQPPTTGPLSQTMVNDINTRIAAYAGTGLRLIIRFIYNFGPIGPGGPDAPLNVILGHIDQLAPVLLQNKDLIFALQAGFIGTWGEWHDSTNGNDTQAAHQAVLDKELAYFAGAFPIQVREPGVLAAYTGTSTPQPALGIHDDYFASSSNDANTWAPCLTALGYCLANYTQSQLMTYGAAVSASATFVGEFGAVYPALQTCSALDAYSTRFHLQSISLFPYPADVGTELQQEGCASSLNASSFFNKVGTRIVLQQAAFSGNAAVGGAVTLSLTMVNAGYGRVIRPRPATLILIQNGQTAAQIPIPLASLDLRTLTPNLPQTYSFPFSLPATLLPGNVSAALLLPDPAPSLSAQPAYALPLNSIDQNNLPVFNPATGYDSIATFAVACSYQLGPGGQSFPAAGGSGAVAVSTQPGCPWSVMGVPSWVTLTSPASGVGSGTVTFLIAASNGGDVSASFTIAGQTFTVEQVALSIPNLNFVGSMPHLASAGNWETTFTLVNNGASASTVRLNLFADSGAPLALPLTFPQNASTSSLLASTLDRTLNANASLLLDSTGPASAPVQVGSTQLLATGNVEGFAIFKNAGQEAVVPLETRKASSYVLAFDVTNGATLGIAVANVSANAANIPVVLRDDQGALLASSTLALAAFGHSSFELTAKFPAAANGRGSIEFDTSAGAQISALGIRVTPSGTITTIPVLANVTSAGGSVAHLASGGGWMTTVVLVNTGSTAAQAQLAFFDDGGNPLPLPLTYPQTGVTTNASASVSQTIAPNASSYIQTGGPAASALQTGSMQLATNGNVGGFVIFRYLPNGQEASAPIQNLGASAYVLAFDHIGGLVTGVAVNNASAQPIAVPVILRDDLGDPIGTGSLPLAANGHSSFSLASQFPVTANIRGTAEFDAPNGGQINVLGMRSPPSLTFTSLPPLIRD